MIHVTPSQPAGHVLVGVPYGDWLPLRVFVLAEPGARTELRPARVSDAGKQMYALVEGPVPETHVVPLVKTAAEFETAMAALIAHRDARAQTMSPTLPL